MNNMNKKQQILYCICFVIVLLLLLFGDAIITRAIPTRINLNNKVFGGEEIDAVMKTDEYIKTVDLLNKIDNKESFYLFSLRSNCINCELLEEKINNFDKLNYEMYYIDQDYVINDASWEDFLEVDENIKLNIEMTPFLMKFENGILTDYLIGNQKDEYLKQFFT